MINKLNFEKYFFESKVQLGVQTDEAMHETGCIEAMVTTFGPREGADGRKFNYKAEGFANWMDEFMKSEKPLPMYFQHNDMSMPVGEWYEFMMDDEGMHAKGKMFLNTSMGKDLYTIMKESPNLVGGVSVGAYADEYCMTDKEGNVLADDDDMDEAYFQITKGGLREVSIVMQPNNLDAEISKLECFRADGSLDLKLIEKALRDARKDATTASSIFKQILETRDEPKVIFENTPIQSESDAVVNQEAELLKAFEQRELLKHLNNRLKG